MIALPDVEVKAKDNERWYRKRGGAIWYPSATTVLSLFWKPPVEAASQYEFARQRGTEVHRGIELLCRGMKLDEIEMDDDEVRPRVARFAEWQEKTGWVSVYIEQPFVSEAFRFGTTPDHVGYFRASSGVIEILDTKPPKANPLVGPQLAAQALAVKETLRLSYAPDRTALLLSHTRARPMPLLEHSTERDLFLSALSWWGYLRNRGWDEH